MLDNGNLLLTEAISTLNFSVAPASNLALVLREEGTQRYKTLTWYSGGDTEVSGTLPVSLAHAHNLTPKLLTITNSSRLNVYGVITIDNKLVGIITSGESIVMSGALPVYCKVAGGDYIPLHSATNPFYEVGDIGQESATFEVAGFNLDTDAVSGADEVDGGRYGMNVGVSDVSAIRNIYLTDDDMHLKIIHL